MVAVISILSLLCFLLPITIKTSSLYEGRFKYSALSSPIQEKSHDNLYKYIVLLAEGKRFSDSEEYPLKDLISAATALVPVGLNVDQGILSQSALGVKINALKIVEGAISKAVLDDEDTLNLICILIETHLFYNQSLFETTLVDTFYVLDADDISSNVRVREPAFYLFLEPIFRITLSLIEIRAIGSVSEHFRSKISPSFVASMVPLLMSPMFNERMYVNNILDMSILCLDESYSLAILNAFNNYLDCIIAGNLPLRGVNDILELFELILTQFSLYSIHFRSALLDLVHSRIYPLYRSRFFYVIAEKYANIIQKTIFAFYRNPLKIQEDQNEITTALFSKDSDYFIDHPFVNLCRKNFVRNIPRGDVKNEVAFMVVMEKLSCLIGFFHEQDLPFIMKNLLCRIKYSTNSDFVVLIYNLIQFDILQSLDGCLLRKVLKLIWSSNFYMESSVVSLSMQSLIQHALSELEHKFQDLFIEFNTTGTL